MVLYIFLALLLPSAPFLVYLYLYNLIEKRAKQTIELLPKAAKSKYADVRIWFKGYDMLKRRNWPVTDMLKSLYVYNLADLFVFEQGIVVVGKMKIAGFGRLRLLSPFVICRQGAQSQFPMVTYRVDFQGANLVGPDLDITFQDHDYTNAITMVVKAVGQDLYGKMGPN